MQSWHTGSTFLRPGEESRKWNAARCSGNVIILELKCRTLPCLSGEQPHHRQVLLCREQGHVDRHIWGDLGNISWSSFKRSFGTAQQARRQQDTRKSDQDYGIRRTSRSLRKKCLEKCINYKAVALERKSGGDNGVSSLGYGRVSTPIFRGTRLHKCHEFHCRVSEVHIGHKKKMRMLYVRGG